MAYAAGSMKASGLRAAGGVTLHSLPGYHGLLLGAAAITGAVIPGIASAAIFGHQSLYVPIAAAIGAAPGTRRSVEARHALAPRQSCWLIR